MNTTRALPLVVLSVAIVVALLSLSTDTVPAQSPQPPRAAGIIVSPDTASPTTSSLWFWNEAGLFQHLVGTFTAVAITDPLNAAIPNVRGMIASPDSTSPTGNAVWLWNDVGVYYNLPGTTTAIEISDPLGNAIPDVRGMVTSTDLSSPTGSAVWIWNDVGVYLHLAGTTTTTEVTDPLGASIPNVRGIIASTDLSSPAGSAVWLWNDTGVYLHLAGTATTLQITDPLGAPISNVQGITASTDLTSTPRRDLLWIWNDSHLYLHIPGPSVGIESAAPLTTVEIIDPLGAPIPDLRGIVVGSDNTSPTGSAVWLWNDVGVFLYRTGTLTTSEITDTLGTAIPDVRGIVTSIDLSSPIGSAVWIWNDAGVYLHLAGTVTTLQITDPLGAPIPNVRGIIASTDLTSTPCRDLLWIWNDSHLYLNIPGPSVGIESAAPLTTVEITDPLGAPIPDLRGMIAGRDDTSPTGSAVWLWNDVGVFLYRTGTLTTIEITDPLGGPIVNNWAIIVSPDTTSPTLNSVWIRNNLGIFQHTAGTNTTQEITGPFGQSIPTPDFDPPHFAVAVVKQVQRSRSGGAGVAHPPSPFNVDFLGAGLAASVHVPISPTTPPGLTSITAAGGVQIIRNSPGTSLFNDHVAVLLTAQEPPITPKGWLEGTVTDAFSGDPLEASIVVLGQPDTVTTDPNTGNYRLWLDAGNYNVQAAAVGYVTQTALVDIAAQQGTTQDFALVPNVPVLAISPESLAVINHVGDLTTRTLTISNNGPAALDFAINLLPGGSDAPWLSIDPISGTVPAYSSTPIQLTFNATGLQPETYTTQIPLLSNDPLTPTISIPVTMTVLPFAWSDVCVPQRVEIAGIGMGDRDHTINPQALALAAPSNLNWLLAQVSGRIFRAAPLPESVTFASTAPQSRAMTTPSSSLVGYTFETHLQTTALISVSVSGVGADYKTPRAFVVYTKRATEMLWTSVGKTTNGYVYAGLGEYTHTEVLAFPPLSEATDLYVTAVVIDNDDDSRPLVVQATAGDVTASVTEPGPTHGEGLNIVSLTLEQVLTGTEQISVTLQSPPNVGDSLVMVGLNVNIPCAWNMPRVKGVTPAPNSHTAAGDTNLSVSISGLVHQASLTPENLSVHAGFQGHLDLSLGFDDSTSAGDIVVDPVAGFRPGESVQVTISRDLRVNDMPLSRPYVWQFRTAIPNTGGNGHFTNSGQSLGSLASEALALGDLDGDGDLDAFVTNRTQANEVWLNDGLGIFITNSQSLGGSSSHDVALGDVDGDGDLDAFVTNRTQANEVWLNDGLGIFITNGQSLGGSSSHDVALGDVDGDGDLDAFVAHWEQPNEVWLNDGGVQGGTPGSFSDGGQRLGSTDSSGVSLGDLDSDGDLDAFVANLGANQVWTNIGSGTFRDSGQNLGSSHSTSVALGDIDNDGDLDAFVANHLGQPDRVWLNDGMGTFSDSGQRLGLSASLEVRLGDLDGDSDLDAAVANWMQPNRVWINDGTGIFSDSSRRLGSSYGEDLALGDLDGDGDLDAFVAHWSAQTNEVWFNREPIVLSSFVAAADPKRITLVWHTVSEIDSKGFNLWRSTKPDGLYARLNDTLIPARGNANGAASYRYIDPQVIKGISYYYRLENVGLRGAITFYGPVSATPPFLWRFYLPLLFEGSLPKH